MTLPDDPHHPVPTPSIAARLRQRFGTDVDPRVELVSEEVDRASPPGGTQSRAASSGVLDRLSARGAAATRYRLRGEIARGGMGAILEVFDEDLRRRLAMKVILDPESGAAGSSLGNTNPAMLARFLEEAQVTGQLDHPGIVPVHELGLDPNGQVYFTMRLVHGRDLEAIFDLAASGKEGWSTTRVLGVLHKVCEAMAYAHAKGVVHRDLKPANIMVGRFGEVYVMDWGLARVLDRPAHVRDRPAHVRDQKDPRDAHPRIAAASRGTGAALRATDHAHGELHEHVATDRRDGSGRPLDDALHTLDGTVVGTPGYMAPEQARGDNEAIDARTDVYAVGGMLYRLLAGIAPHSVPGESAGAVVVWKRVLDGPPAPLEEVAPDAPDELVAISDKAMAREPADRYQDMLALSEDLRAFLEGRVVQAFETGALAQTRKWVRRNRPLAAALAALVLALASGLVASLVFAGEARDNAELAEVRRAEADANAVTARRQARIAGEVNAFLNNGILASVAPEHDGFDVTVREVLDHAALQIDARFRDDPMVEAEVRMTIGTSYERLGEYEVARQHLERALELRKVADGERAESTLQAMRQVASIWAELGRDGDAIGLYEEALEIARELLGPEHRGTLSTMNDLALVLVSAGRFDEARALYEALLPLEQQVLGADFADSLSTENNLALLDQKQGRLHEAEQRLESVLERRRAVSGERHPDTLNAQSNLAQVLSDLGRFGESDALARATLELRRAAFGPEHPLVGRELGALGTNAMRRGRLDEAQEHFTEALRIARLSYGDGHAETLLAENNLGVSIQDPARREEKLALFRSVLGGREKLFGPRHPDTLLTMNSVATTLRELGRMDEALQVYEKTLELQREVLGEEHPSTLVTAENLAGLYYATKDYARGEPIVRAVLEARRRVLGEEHPDVAKTTYNLAMVVKGKGDAGAARALFEEALAKHRSALGRIHPMVAECLRQLGDLRDAAKEHPEALAAFREALDVRRALHPDNADSGYLLHQIGVAYTGLADHASALRYYDEAVELRERLLGPEAAGTRVSLYMHARTLVDLGRYAEAEGRALEFKARTDRAAKPDPGHIERGRKLLADLYDKWSKPDEAAKWR